MIIDPNNSQIGSSSTASGKARSASSTLPDAATKVAQAPVAKTGDSVSLSAEGQNIAALEASLAKSPEVSESRVAEIKASIADGSYSINSHSIANKLLEQDSLL